MSETTTETINFRINDYENIEPHSLDTESANDLLSHLSKDAVNGSTFFDFCYACDRNTLNTELVNDLVKHLSGDSGIGNDVLYNFSSACQPETLNQDLISNLLNRLHRTKVIFKNGDVVKNEPVEIGSDTFLKFCRACKPNTLSEANFAILLEHLGVICCIDDEIFYYLNKACVKHSLNDTKIIEKLLSHLIMNNHTFVSLCSICNYAVLDENMTSQIFKSNKISFNEIKCEIENKNKNEDKNKKINANDCFSKILSKFTPYARTIVLQKMQKDLTCNNKIGVGFGIALTVIGTGGILVGILFPPAVPFLSTAAVYGLCVYGGGTISGFSLGTAIYNIIKNRTTKQNVNNLLNQAATETSEGSNSTQTHEERGENPNNPTWVIDISTGAIAGAKQFNGDQPQPTVVNQDGQVFDNH